MARPDDLKYTETHEWMKIDKKKKIVTIGITDYAVAQLSDLVHIELPDAGDKLEAGQPFGEIESVKAVSDLFAPVSGDILESNEDVQKDLDLLAKDPFEDGWLIKVNATDLGELEGTMSRKEYDEFVESEASGDADDDEKTGGDEKKDEEE